ncbi:MAG: hypothetical protein AAF699_09260 [Pseudomonadota bacterium]
MATESSNHPTWPEAYEELLPILCEQWQVDGEIYLNRLLRGGRSTAVVCAVDVSTPTFTGQAILKLETVDDSQQQETLEAALHATAISDSPEYAASHLPRVLNVLHHEDKVAVLSTIAGRALEYAQPWDNCAFDRRLVMIRRISTGILDDWNAHYSLSDGLLSPQALLRDWLGHRIETASGGRIRSFLSEICGLNTDTASISFNGHWFPNPLAFIDKEIEDPDQLQLRSVIGHTHGDFHGLNVLVEVDHLEVPNYHLIDLAKYQSEQHLFYDHAYFELAMLINSRGSSSVQSFEAVIAQLRRYRHEEELGLEPDDYGLLELIRALRAGVQAWIERHEADRLASMESQLLLARVAAGLNFTHKRLSEQMRRVAFFYAAANLKDYFKLNRVSWPRSGVEFHMEAATQPSHPMPEARETVTPSSGSLTASDGVATGEEQAVSGEGSTLQHQRSIQSKPISRTVRASRSVWLLRVAIATPGLAALIVLAMLLLQDKAPNQRAESEPAPAHEAIASPLTPPTLTNRRQDIVGQRSIAVLPFSDVGADSDGSFAHGLTIEIIHLLNSTGVFRVPGFRSAFQFKDDSDDLKLIGESLDVEYVLEGSVEQARGEVKIEAKLIRIDNGDEVWSGRYREEINDVFVAQEKIANAIGDALSTPLDIDSVQLEANRTAHPQAYEAFLKGIALLEQRGTALIGSIAAFERAVSIEPEFAAAWGGLSIATNIAPTYLKQANNQPVDPNSYYQKSKRAALRALELDPNLTIVQHAIANVYNRERRWLLSEQAYLRSLQLNPANHRAMQDYGGLLHTVGRELDSLNYLNRAKALDPINDLYIFMSARVAFQETGSEDQLTIIKSIFHKAPPLRELAMRIIIGEDAEDGVLDQAQELITECADCTSMLRNRILDLLGDFNTDSADEIFEQHKNDVFLSYKFMHAIGGIDSVLDLFEYNALQSQFRLQYFTVPWFFVDELESRKRFHDIVLDMGLEDYWVTAGWPSMCRSAGSDFVCTSDTRQ